MEKEGKAGLATFVMRGKEYLVAIFGENSILRAETMRFPDELRTPGDIGLPEKPKVPRATVAKFEKLISSKSKKQLSPRKLEDEQTERLLKLVKRRAFNARISSRLIATWVISANQERSSILVAVLKKSLAGKG